MDPSLETAIEECQNWFVVLEAVHRRMSKLNNSTPDDLRTFASTSLLGLAGDSDGRLRPEIKGNLGQFLFQQFGLHVQDAAYSPPRKSFLRFVRFVRGAVDEVLWDVFRLVATDWRPDLATKDDAIFAQMSFDEVFGEGAGGNSAHLEALIAVVQSAVPASFSPDGVLRSLLGKGRTVSDVIDVLLGLGADQ